jgi:hypothetical protein
MDNRTKAKRVRTNKNFRRKPIIPILSRHKNYLRFLEYFSITSTTFTSRIQKT